MDKRVIERNMFYGAKKNIFLRAVMLRKNMTEAEKILWKELRKRDVFKARWKRQHPIDIFIVDFYCHEYKLVIELDGEIHLREDVQEHDNGREYEIEKFGITILRFTKKEIYEDLALVKDRILTTISSLNPL